MARLRLVPPPFPSQPWMVEHLALIYGESRILDTCNDLEMSIRIATLAFGSAGLKAWLEHPQRRLILRAEIPGRK